MNEIFKIVDKDILVTDLNNSAYMFYVHKSALQLDVVDKSSGKWIVNAGNSERAARICLSAAMGGVVKEAKHTKDGRGLCFFYVDSQDIIGHKKIIALLLSQKLVPKTNSGKLSNLAYKLDAQTRAGQYGPDSVLYHLSDFIDLETEKWRF